MTAEAALQGCRSVFLDAAPTIYYLSADSPFSARAVLAIAYCVRERIRIVTSPVTLAESLVGESDPFKQRTTRNLLTTQIVMVDIDASIAEEAAALRRTTRLKLPDCLQLATALASGCDAFLTNDVQISKTPVNLKFILVRDLT